MLVLPSETYSPSHSHTRHSPPRRNFTLPYQPTIAEEETAFSGATSKVKHVSFLPATSLLPTDSKATAHARKPRRYSFNGSMLRPNAVPPKAGGQPFSTMSHSSSTRTYSDDAAPTVAMLAHERESNMRTPRPHTSANEGGSVSASSSSAAALKTPTATALGLPGTGILDAAEPDAGSSSKARIMQWQQRREASDATIEAREGTGSDFRSPDYASDSIGRLSVASSALASGSEFGHGLRSANASEQGTDRGSSFALGPRRNRKVAPPELLVVVRPPPSKQGNPLNLQIQLVTPQQTGATSGGRTSGELSRDEMSASSTNASLNSTNSGLAGDKLKSPGGPLRRSNSVSSSRSAFSEASSAAFSSGSAGSSARRVTPLYNLCFHSIMPTTVTDAGTDQKVAKFGKRGVEIDGFGQLTPHELAMGINDLASLDRRRRSVAVGAGTGSGLNSPEARSEVSLAARSAEAVTTHTGDSGSETGVLAVVNGSTSQLEPPTSFDAMSPRAKEASRDAGGLGGKLLRSFKRFSINAGAAPMAASSNSITTASASDRSGEAAEAGSTATSIIARVRGAAAKVKDGASGDGTLNGGGPSDDGDVMSVASTAADSDIPQLVVGAGLRGDGTRRAQGYYWMVRRWSRRLGEGTGEDVDGVVPGRQRSGENAILNSVWKRFNIVNRMGGNEVHPPASQIPVRFEWTRSEARKKSAATSSSGLGLGGRHGRAATDFSGAGAAKLVRRPSSARASFDARRAGQEGAPDEAARQSNEALRPPSVGGSGSGSRPTSLYRSGGAGRGSMDRTSAVSIGDEDSDPEDSETKWACHLVLGPTTRIPIGSLAPTPHHPKLVAQLTVPYPLPDLSQSGLGVDGAGLTREELKDIISVTALFVIVREAFGGLAKRRKGDSALKFGAAVVQR